MTEVAKDYEHEPDAKVGISVLYLISEVSEDLEQGSDEHNDDAEILLHKRLCVLC